MLVLVIILFSILGILILCTIYEGIQMIITYKNIKILEALYFHTKLKNILNSEKP